MISDHLKKFPKIEKKEGNYYLFLGLIAGLNANEICQILEPVFNADIFKRKILIARIGAAATGWSEADLKKIEEEFFRLINSLDTYHKKESTSQAMMALCPPLPTKAKKKVLNFLLTSDYINNRKRAYVYLQQNWSETYQDMVSEAWNTYGDEEAIKVMVAHSASTFLLENLDELMEFFADEDIKHDFWLMVLRNKFFARIANHIPELIEKLKEKEPISYISIMKDSGQKIDPKWALEVYKKNPDTRYLARWYGEMGLWEDLLKLDPDIINK